VLVGFGAGALAGTTTGGRLGDRWPLATTITAAASASVVLLLLTIWSHHTVAAIALVVLMGLAGFAVNPVVSALAVRFAGAPPDTGLRAEHVRVQRRHSRRVRRRRHDPEHRAWDCPVQAWSAPS
jgi:predicted MFS family arabinose efflux permease